MCDVLLTPGVNQMCDVLLTPGVNQMCYVLLAPGVNPIGVKKIKQTITQHTQSFLFSGTYFGCKYTDQLVNIYNRNMYGKCVWPKDTVENGNERKIWILCGLYLRVIY
jgi:hypothetical protein